MELVWLSGGGSEADVVVNGCQNPKCANSYLKDCVIQTTGYYKLSQTLSPVFYSVVWVPTMPAYPFFKLFDRPELVVFLGIPVP